MGVILTVDNGQGMPMLVASVVVLDAFQDG